VNKNVKRLIDRMRNGLRALGHTRRDGAQTKLLADVSATLALLEFEVLKESETLTERSE
jgi:hypothetical protein